jgi:hypothetical protein
MADSIDWTDETLRTLDELARIAFPLDSGVTAKTLRLRARQGKLAVYRPGKAHLSTLVGIKAMVEATRVPAVAERAPVCIEKDALGLTPMQRSSLALDMALAKLDALREPARAEKRLRAEERARTAPERLRAAKAKRSKRAKARYLERKAARAAADA